MLIDVERELRNAGLQISIRRIDDDLADAVLDVHADGREIRFVVDYKSRAPYPNEVDRLGPRRERLAELGHPLIAATFVNGSIGEVLTAAGWSWADEHGNFDIRGPGLLLKQRTTSTPPKRASDSLPKGTGSHAIIRNLIKDSAASIEIQTTSVASQARVTQPRASQVMSKLQQLGLAAKSDTGRWTIPDRAALLERFLDEYPGPGGAEEYYYSLDSPLDAAMQLAQQRPSGLELAISADVGPDLIAPWRRSEKLTIYVEPKSAHLQLDAVVASSPSAANIIVRVPQDTSVFPTPRLVAVHADTELPLADPVQMVWDLIELGGADRAEAAESLKRWILDQP
ncbi:MAG: hypothetical protein CL424_04375 [Acidimicrobiaceae bacterium]|nr:hypothetical protein [Acidimicrobiaceae bacterium]